MSHAQLQLEDLGMQDGSLTRSSSPFREQLRKSQEVPWKGIARNMDSAVCELGVLKWSFVQKGGRDRRSYRFGAIPQCDNVTTHLGHTLDTREVSTRRTWHAEHLSSSTECVAVFKSNVYASFLW